MLAADTPIRENSHGRLIPGSKTGLKLSRIVALRCFEWVIASWADLAESAALRLFKVEAGINGLRPACAGPLHLIRFSLEQTSLRAGEVARFGVRQIDRSFLALICATLNVSGPEQIAGSGGMMGCYDTG